MRSWPCGGDKPAVDSRAATNVMVRPQVRSNQRRGAASSAARQAQRALTATGWAPMVPRYTSTLTPSQPPCAAVTDRGLVLGYAQQGPH